MSCYLSKTFATLTFMVLLAVTGKGMAQQFAIVESAPDNGLVWLAAQQKDDGSWQTRKSVEDDKSAGRKVTSLSLLAFLAGGHTHKDGKYKTVVEKGLTFILESAKADVQKGEDLQRGGEIDSHALATMVLCESYSMTDDKELAVPAQQAIGILVQSQNNDGGWGKQPGKASTTLDIGLPVMALMSGRLANLDVPEKAVEGAARFLDQVQQEDGVYYGLTKPEKRADTTSVGLLCRLLLGAKRGDPAIKKGIKYLAATGPSDNDLHFNYFSTLTLFGSEQWTRWNVNLQRQVLAAQDKASEFENGKGSWPPIDASYGRIESTAMNLVCLQVYYRHLPMHLELSQR